MAPDRRGAREKMVSKTAKKMENQAKKEMKDRFAAIVGNAETLEKIAAASQWMTSMTCTPQDLLKFHTFNAHMKELKEYNVWPDIIQYRMIGQISTYFLSGQSLRDRKPDDINALDELEISVCGWVRLASEGRLSRLEEFAGVENGEGRYKSVAERLKAFMDAYKRKGEYDIWTYDRMKVLRYDIYKVVHELDAETERPMLPSMSSNGDRTLKSTEAERSFDEDTSRDSEEPSFSNNGHQRHSEASNEEDEEDLYSATPPTCSTRRPRAESFHAATPNSGQHMLEQSESAEPSSRTRGNGKRHSPETDDRNPAKLQKRLDDLDKSISAKQSSFEDKQAAANLAQEKYSIFSDTILAEVGDILGSGRVQGYQEWTATAIRTQMDRFQGLGEMIRHRLGQELLLPLEEANETQSALEMAHAKRGELTRKLEEAKRRS